MAKTIIPSHTRDICTVRVSCEYTADTPFSSPGLPFGICDNTLVFCYAFLKIVLELLETC
jgi:hypothetical protein